MPAFKQALLKHQSRPESQDAWLSSITAPNEAHSTDMTEVHRQRTQTQEEIENTVVEFANQQRHTHDEFENMLTT